jgi:hypothetical protein
MHAFEEGQRMLLDATTLNTANNVAPCLLAREKMIFQYAPNSTVVF